MRLRDFPLLADENLHSEVVAFLRGEGFDVVVAGESIAAGTDDIDLIRLANGTGRVIVTHDSDFGQLAVAQMEPMIGIIFLRPGHIASDLTIASLRAVLSQPLDLKPPFIVVAERRGTAVRIRLRTL